jgi:hypothetical protein
MLQRIQRHGSIHCAGVDVDVMQLFGYCFGDGALTAGGVSIDGNIDFGFHGVEQGLCESNSIPLYHRNI